MELLQIELMSHAKCLLYMVKGFGHHAMPHMTQATN